MSEVYHEAPYKWPHRTYRQNATWDGGFTRGEAVFHRGSNEILYVEEVEWGPDGRADNIEVSKGDGSYKFTVSPNSVRRPSLLEKTHRFIEERFLGKYSKVLSKLILKGVNSLKKWALKEAKISIRRIMYAGIVIVYAILFDPWSLIREAIDFNN